MFKIRIPAKFIMSSGSFLMLLALGSLILMGSTAYTSDIKNQKHEGANEVSNHLSDKKQDFPELGRSTHDIADTNKSTVAGKVADSRYRSSRMFQQTNGNPSAPLESYAAAYAAANSPGSGSSEHITQQTSSDASTYTSFGETPPGTSSGGSEREQVLYGSTARQVPISNEFLPASNFFANYMSPSSNDVTYRGQSSSHYRSPGHVQHHYYKTPEAPLPAGYPTNAYERGYPTSSHYDRVSHHIPAASSPFWASTSSFNSGGGLMSSASNAISHWANGFSVGEIICGLVALAIGAVILGAPFFLIYLALMGSFSGSGTLSLTNPTSTAAAAGGASTTSNGRRKRLAVYEAMNLSSEQEKRHPDFSSVAETVVKRISPYVDLQQVSRTFRQLISSIEKHSPSQQRADSSVKSKTS